VPEHPGSPTYCLEHLIEGDYIKYNNNCGFVEGADAEDERVRDTPQAFSHFTFEYTKGQKIVVDIQGVSGCGLGLGGSDCAANRAELGANNGEALGACVGIMLGESGGE
jgi:hypothetical protein